MRSKRLLIAVLLIITATVAAAQQAGAPALSGDQIVDRVSPAVVLILAGSGDGQVGAVGSGLVVRSDGVVLTANHLLKDMKEVQVRLKNGEVFDRVELVASDERRDIAAIRIAATGLPVLAVSSAAELHAGAPIYVVSNGVGLPWTASSGVLSATRMAEEVPGAGSGYRLLQVTAPMSPGSSGGAVVDAQARALGIVVGSISPGQNVNFAVPVDSVLGLASATGGTAFASGARLHLTTANASPGPAARPAAPSADLPRGQQAQIRTVSVHSKTVYIRRERLQDDLRKHPQFGQLGVRFADYGETPDVAVTVDRPFLTYDWTYTLVYQPTGITLASGSIIADDEFDAGPSLAAQIMDQLAAAAVLPRSAFRSPEAGRADTVARAQPTNILSTCKKIFVESHTIYLKGNHLQDALYTRPELREWGVRLVDDRQAADVYIDVTRPFLTFDWVYKIIDNRTGAVLATGKVIAWDGPIAAPQLASEILKHMRAARPLPSAEKQAR